MEEIAEIDEFINKTRYEGVKIVLTKYKAELQQKLLSQTNTTKNISQIPAANTSGSSTNNVPNKTVIIPPSLVSGIKFLPIENFAWDQGEHNSSLITIYIDDLDGVGALPTENIIFTPTKASFELTINDLNGKNYKLIKDNLEKDIIPEESTIIIKKNKIILKLKKKKGEYSYEHWSSLTSKKPRTDKIESKSDPMGGLMDMMKSMYEDGDEQTKKLIGEAMMKSRSGEKMEPPKI